MNEYSKGVLGGLLRICGLVMLTSGLSYGVTVACVNNSTLQIDDIDNAAPNGCGSVNMSFENMVMSTTGTDGGFSASTAETNVNVSAGANPTLPVNLTFSPTANADWDENDNNDSLRITLNYLAVVHTGGLYGPGNSLSYTAASGPGFNWFLDTISFAASGAKSDSDDTLTVTTTICLNGTTATGAGCSNTALNQAVITLTFIAGQTNPNFSCAESSAVFTCAAGVLDVESTYHVTQIGVRTVVFGERPGNGSRVDLDSFTLGFNSYTDTPEPSTLGMMSAALVGLGFLARRRRKI